MHQWTNLEAAISTRSVGQLRDVTIVTLLETVFSMWSAPRLYQSTDRVQLSSGERGMSTRVEAGSNTSTVALRVVGAEEKGTKCLGV
jgi:hypothetical protein